MLGRMKAVRALLLACLLLAVTLLTIFNVTRALPLPYTLVASSRAYHLRTVGTIDHRAGTD